MVNYHTKKIKFYLNCLDIFTTINDKNEIAFDIEFTRKEVQL